MEDQDPTEPFIIVVERDPQPSLLQQLGRAALGGIVTTIAVAAVAAGFKALTGQGIPLDIQTETDKSEAN